MEKKCEINTVKKKAIRALMAKIAVLFLLLQNKSNIVTGLNDAVNDN